MELKLEVISPLLVVVAARVGKPAPSLLPEVATSCAQFDLLKAA